MLVTRRMAVWSLSAVLVGAVLPTAARAQDRGNFDPAQMRERMMNGIRERMGATEEEWRVISPKLEKVMTAQRDARGGGFGGGSFGGRGGGRGGDRDRGGDRGGSENQGPVARASADLRTALENKDTPAPEIAKKLAAYREARQTARANLEAAQKDLKEVLTQRQEASLVSMGMLE